MKSSTAVSTIWFVWVWKFQKHSKDKQKHSKKKTENPKTCQNIPKKSRNIQNILSKNTKKNPAKKKTKLKIEWNGMFWNFLWWWGLQPKNPSHIWSIPLYERPYPQRRAYHPWLLTHTHFGTLRNFLVEHHGTWKNGVDPVHSARFRLGCNVVSP